MSEVSFNTHHFGHRLLLEVIIDEGAGDVSAYSLEFDVHQNGSKYLAPYDVLPRAYETEIRAYLEGAGFTLLEQSVV